MIPSNCGGTDLKLGRLAAFLEAKVGLGQPDDCLIQIHALHIEAEDLMQVDRQATSAQAYYQNLALAFARPSLLCQSISYNKRCHTVVACGLCNLQIDSQCSLSEQQVIIV